MGLILSAVTIKSALDRVGEDVSDALGLHSDSMLDMNDALRAAKDRLYRVLAPGALSKVQSGVHALGERWVS